MERKVTVGVEIKATSNVAAVARGDQAAVRGLAASVDQGIGRRATAIAQPRAVTALAGNGGGVFASQAAPAGVVQTAAAARSGMATPSIDTRPANNALTQFSANVKEAGFTGMNALKGLALASGAVAASSPMVFETLKSSVSLAAGELGILLIPAVVKVANFMGGLAETVRTVDEATGGLAGRFLSTAAIAGLAVVATSKTIDAYSTIANVFGASKAAAAETMAATSATKLAGAAEIASASLTKLSATSGVAGVAGAGATAASGGAGGRFGGMAGRLAIAGGAAVVGQVAGAAIGDNTVGNAVSAAGTGAMIGAVAGPLGALIGGAIGAGFSLVAKATESRESKMAKLATGFQAGAIESGMIHEVVQREAFRDPAQQARAEQDMRAMDKLLEELGMLNRNLSNRTPPPPWPANN